MDERIENATGRGGDRPVPWRRALLLAGLLPAGVLVRFLGERAPGTTEALYSQGLFPVLQAGVTTLARLSPISLGEVLLVLVVGWTLVRLARGVRGRRRGERSFANLGLHAGAQVAAAAGILYAAFLLLWGLNYGREPFALHAGLEVRPATSAELAEVTLALVEEVNELRGGLPEDGAGVMRAEGGRGGVSERVAGVFERAARAHSVLAGRAPVVRAPLLSPVMTACGIAGIYWPFTGEPHVNANLPEPVFAFSLCHEVAHQRGFAREDEANFIAYLVCTLSGDADLSYSGTLAALDYALVALAGVDDRRSAELLERCSPGVLRDLAAKSEFWRPRSQVARLARSASGRANDLYLKTQGQRDGARSYGRMVDLLIAERRAVSGK